MSPDDPTRLLEQLRYALDQSAIVALTDQQGIITYVNDKFCEISKYSRDELLGQDHRIINSGYHPKEFIRDLWRTIAQGRIWRGELRNRAKDGSIYWVDTTIVPLLNRDGKPRQYIAIRSDITSRKAIEQQLVDQTALAQLGQLAAVVAHEVRNPLAGVKGSLQVLRSRPATEPDDKRVIDAMIARLDVLNSKVGDILRFARPRAPVIADRGAAAGPARRRGQRRSGRRRSERPGIRLPETAAGRSARSRNAARDPAEPAAERLPVGIAGADRDARSPRTAARAGSTSSIGASASARPIPNGCSKRSTRPRRAARDWAWRSSGVCSRCRAAR